MSRLAPGAKAQLEMRTGDHVASQSSEDTSGTSSQGSEIATPRGAVPLVEQLTGIGISVSNAWFLFQFSTSNELIYFR
jgi:hypothetical protein